MWLNYPIPSSLSDLKEIGCKSVWTVHISPLFRAIERLLAFKICPRPVTFSLRFFKSDRLQGPSQVENGGLRGTIISQNRFDVIYAFARNNDVRMSWNKFRELSGHRDLDDPAPHTIKRTGVIQGWLVTE
jgi:hypothetical protein